METGILKEVLPATQPAQIALIKSILDGEKIHYVVQGENHSSMELFPVRFLVSTHQADRAKDVLADFL